MTRLSILLALTLCSVIASSQVISDKEAIKRQLEAASDAYGETAQKIWRLAELGFLENESVALLTGHLEEAGFRIEDSVAGMPTAFIAEWGSGTPVIGMLAEYDALPGMAQAPVPYPEPLEGGKAGHACGHHLFGTGAVAATIAVKNWMQSKGQRGTIRLYGTPAEEGGGAKVYMVREGLFDDVDAVLTWHPGDINGCSPVSTLSAIGGVFTFSGIASHAARAPERGRSALDGVEAMNHMVNLAPRIIQWIQNGQPLANAQFVFFTWPSEDRFLNLGPIDLAPRGVQASYNGIYLARFLTQIPAQIPVSLVGHSHGTRMIGAALHMLGGGYVGRYRLAKQPEPRRLRTVFLAAAIDRHWLMPKGRFEAALPVMERMLNMVNRSDYSLLLYPLRRPFSDVAIGHVGLGKTGSVYLGPYRDRYRDFDVTNYLGASHGWEAHLRQPEIAQIMANTVFYSEPVAIGYQTNRVSPLSRQSHSRGSQGWCGCGSETILQRKK